jgi:aerobic-type carbon monoxide dehydrogenase small subunit (CoxS/CutS family)
MPETFRVHVNGAEHTVVADGDTPLLYVLRNDCSACQPSPQPHQGTFMAHPI